MGDGKKKIRTCLCVVVILAIVIGILYYYGQMQEHSDITEGTLVSAFCTEMRR